jgi:hypothetical protein
VRLLVEVDVALPPDMPLHEAHDIGESLQTKLESLSIVDRAFVHLVRMKLSFFFFFFYFSLPTLSFLFLSAHAGLRNGAHT